MSDPRNEKGKSVDRRVTATNSRGGQNLKSNPLAEENTNDYSKSSAGVPSSPGTAKWTTKTTRTPATQRTKEVPRSQTIPIRSVENQRRTPVSSATLPNPHSGQNPSPSSASQPSQHLQVGLESKNRLDGTGYIVEQLSPSGLAGEQSGSNQWLAVHGGSMPVPDVRQSGSSFQTEPSSYYSADDNWSTSAVPPMPVPDTGRPEKPDDLYESLWRAANPLPISGDGPLMPKPYGEEETSEDGEASSVYIRRESGEHWIPNNPLGMPVNTELQHNPPSSFPSNKRYDARLPATSSGMPSSATTSPRFPIHGSGQINQETSDVNVQSGFPRSSGDTGNARPNIASTAPLRVHHRPASTSPTSATSHNAGRASRPTAQNFDISQPTNEFGHPSPSIVATSNLSQKPDSINTHQNSQHHDSQGPNNSSGAQPQFNPFYSVGSAGSRPAAPASTSPPKASSALSQPTPQRIGSHQANSPPPGAAPSTFSSNVTPNLSVLQTQSSTRPQAANNFRPQNASAISPAASTPGGTSSNNVTPKPSLLQSQTNVRPQATETSRPQNSPGRPPTAKPTLDQQASARPHVAETMLPQNSNGLIKTNTIDPQQQHASQVAESPRPQRTAATPRPQQQPTKSSGSKEQEKEHAKTSSAAITAATPTRPRLHGEPSQMDTQYVNMMLALDDIPTLHNILAGFFNWILLAGFILFPGTFSSLQNLNVANAQIASDLIHAVTNLPLFIVAWVCCGVGAAGMLWLWWRWRKNYLWALNKIFVPGLMNSLAGFISTIANIYGVQHGQYSTTSKSTIIVTGASTGVFLFFFAFYTFWLVKRVKARHDREVGKERTGKYGEGVVDLSKRRA